MNLSAIFKVPDFLRKEHTFVDAVKSGKQAAIVASLGALLACVAPFLGSQINAHPIIAFIFSEQGIQAAGALITGGAAVFHWIGSSPDRGLPAKSQPEAAPSPAAIAPASAVPSVASEPAPPVVQPASDALPSNGTDPMSAGG